MGIANEVQIGGDHYKAAFQHWDFIAESFGSSYFKGVVTKYVFRWRKKNGVEDLRKAHHYVEKLIELCENDEVRQPLPWADASDFCHVNNVEGIDCTIFMAVVAAQDVHALRDVEELLRRLIRHETGVESMGDAAA